MRRFSAIFIALLVFIILWGFADYNATYINDSGRLVKYGIGSEMWNIIQISMVWGLEAMLLVTLALKFASPRNSPGLEIYINSFCLTGLVMASIQTIVLMFGEPDRDFWALNGMLSFGWMILLPFILKYTFYLWAGTFIVMGFIFSTAIYGAIMSHGVGFIVASIILVIVLLSGFAFSGHHSGSGSHEPSAYGNAGHAPISSNQDRKPDPNSGDHADSARRNAPIADNGANTDTGDHRRNTTEGSEPKEKEQTINTDNGTVHQGTKDGKKSQVISQE